MKRILAVLSVVLSANAASASEELLCNAWEDSDYGTGKPFILTKETSTLKSLQFKNAYGEPVIAKYVGNFNDHYGMYLSDVDKYGYMHFYYFSDTAALTKGDAEIYEGQIIKNYKAVCYRN